MLLGTAIAMLLLLIGTVLIDRLLGLLIRLLLIGLLLRLIGLSIGGLISLLLGIALGRLLLIGLFLLGIGFFLHLLGGRGLFSFIEKVIIKRTRLLLQIPEKITSRHTDSSCIYRNSAEPTRIIVAPARAARS